MCFECALPLQVHVVMAGTPPFHVAGERTHISTLVIATHSNPRVTDVATNLSVTLAGTRGTAATTHAALCRHDGHRTASPRVPQDLERQRSTVAPGVAQPDVTGAGSR